MPAPEKPIAPEKLLGQPVKLDNRRTSHVENGLRRITIRVKTA